MALSLSDAPEAGLLIDVEFLLGHESALVGVILTFERGELVLVANADDDQLLVVDTVGPEKRVAASHQRPWNDAIGRHCLWSWSMPNNTGHVDGAQFFFAAWPAAAIVVQLVVSASEIEVFEVLRIPIA